MKSKRRHPVDRASIHVHKALCAVSTAIDRGIETDLVTLSATFGDSESWLKKCMDAAIVSGMATQTDGHYALTSDGWDRVNKGD